MTSPSNPFQTCLVAMPLEENEWDDLYNLTVQRNCTAPGRCESVWWCETSYCKHICLPAGWYFNNTRGQGMDKIHKFPALPLQPQELDILGFTQPFLCFSMNYTSGFNSSESGIDVSGTGINGNTSAWCNHTALW